MVKPVFYSVLDAPGGLFDVIVRLPPDRIIRRDGFLSLAEADEWVDGLRSLMSVLGAPVVQDAVNADTELSAASLMEEFVFASVKTQHELTPDKQQYVTDEIGRIEEANRAWVDPRKPLPQPQTPSSGP